MSFSSEESYTLSKSERLYIQKRIDHLFQAGSSFIAYPLRIVFTISELVVDEPSVAMLVSVSKRKFKRANKRNRVKRLVREAFRLNKHKFTVVLQGKNVGLDIAFLYLKDELPTYADIEKAMLKTIDLLPVKMVGEKPDEINS